MRHARRPSSRSYGMVIAKLGASAFLTFDIVADRSTIAVQSWLVDDATRPRALQTAVTRRLVHYSQA
ncbi:MAG: hypothetical protein NXI32_15925 [bacterium]|nr:hypothetical protein [bacterium]